MPLNLEFDTHFGIFSVGRLRETLDILDWGFKNSSSLFLHIALSSPLRIFFSLIIVCLPMCSLRQYIISISGLPSLLRWTNGLLSWLRLTNGLPSWLRWVEFV